MQERKSINSHVIEHFGAWSNFVLHILCLILKFKLVGHVLVKKSVLFV